MSVAIIAGVLGCGLVAGVMFAFSGFLMAGLDELPPSDAAEAMRAINRTAVEAPLMVAMFGTALVCLGLAAWAVASWGDRRAAWLLAGSALYLVGAVGVTMAANVPLNDRLEAGGSWDDFAGPWTAWNHVRTVASLAAAALLTIGLVDD